MLLWISIRCGELFIGIVSDWGVLDMAASMSYASNTSAVV